MNPSTTMKFLLIGGLSLPGRVGASPQPPHPPPTLPPSLKGVAVPLPKDLDSFVKSRDWAIVLGKGLFWDMDVGSDKQACASCHFHAGADDRIKNQFNPGFPITTDMTFGDASGLTGSGATAGPNYTVVADDFPLHRLSDPENRESPVLYDTDDRFSSQGTFNGAFISTPILPVLGADQCLTPNPATNPFHVGGVFVRKVEPRNTPTMINCGPTCTAIYNYRTVVTLNVTPDLLSIFSGWTGCDSASGTTCAVTMSAAKSVTANFLP